MSGEERSYRAQGIVLGARALGEADRIVRFLTREHGKLDAVAKGARRPKSRIGGRLELAGRVEMMLHRGRSLDVVVSVEERSQRWAALVEPERLTVASLVLERVDVLCEPGEPVPEIFDLLESTLEAIAKSERPHRFIARFSLRLLVVLGSMPPTEACCICSEALEELAWLDASEGGFVDVKCRRPHREEIALARVDRENFAALGRERGVGAAIDAGPQAAAAIEALIAHYCARPLRVSAIPGYAYGPV